MDKREKRKRQAGRGKKETKEDEGCMALNPQQLLLMEFEELNYKLIHSRNNRAKRGAWSHLGTRPGMGQQGLSPIRGGTWVRTWIG